MLAPIQTKLLDEVTPVLRRRAAQPRRARRSTGGARTLPFPSPVPATPLGEAQALPLPASQPAALDPVQLLVGILGDGPAIQRLRVRGDGMRDALVNDGDEIVLQPEHRVGQGELALVRLSGGARALRRLYFEGDRVRLQSESRRTAPEFVDADALVIEGRVLAIVRAGAQV